MCNLLSNPTMLPIDCGEIKPSCTPPQSLIQTMHITRPQNRLASSHGSGAVLMLAPSTTGKPNWRRRRTRCSRHWSLCRSGGGRVGTRSTMDSIASANLSMSCAQGELHREHDRALALEKQVEVRASGRCPEHLFTASCGPFTGWQ